MAFDKPKMVKRCRGSTTKVLSIYFGWLYLCEA